MPDEYIYKMYVQTRIITENIQRILIEFFLKNGQKDRTWLIHTHKNKFSSH